MLKKENDDLKKIENDDLKQIKNDIVCNQSDLKKKWIRKQNFMKKLKKNKPY